MKRERSIRVFVPPPPSCRIRKCSPSVDAAAKKRRRQEAGRSTARPLSAQRHPEGGIQAQDGHRPGLHPSRVRKLNSHDLSVESKKRRSGRKRKLDQQHDVGQKKICSRLLRSGLETGVPGPSPGVLETGEPPLAETGGRQQESVLLAGAARAEPLSGPYNHNL